MGFQVFSYGSPGDDWLDLDQDRARRLVTIDDPILEELGDGTAGAQCSRFQATCICSVR